MEGLDNATIRLVASDVNDLIKEGGHSQLAVIATSGVALTLQALISATTADELPYMVTSNVRSLLRELNKSEMSSDFELGFHVGSISNCTSDYRNRSTPVHEETCT